MGTASPSYLEDILEAYPSLFLWWYLHPVIKCSLGLIFRIIYLFIFMCVCVCKFMTCVEVRRQLAGVGSFLLLCGCQELNFGFQAWQQGPLPIKSNDSSESHCKFAKTPHTHWKLKKKILFYLEFYFFVVRKMQ